MISRVSIIILQYNNSQDTIRCLNSVKELDYPSYEVILVDNGSEVKCVEEIKDWIKKERNLNPSTYYLLLTTNSNLGYSGGNNFGIKYAIENGADYVFILNPDTTIEKDTLTKLVEVAESNSQIGILGPTISENGKIVYGGKIEWLKPELCHLSSLTTNYKLRTTNFYIPGAAMLIKKAAIEKIGLLDERYFLYFEDADYCMRARKVGFKLKIASEARVNHMVSASTSQLSTALLLRYHFRNAHLFNWKNGSFWVKFLLPFWSISIIIKQLTKILLGNNREISKAILFGIFDFYRGKFGQISN